ncbi:MAG TPA: hypothetical protein VFW92_06075 [Candidatus Limnocylindrales bacterium]|nr:hypothetical protein [Candidatus Limnocylindrales bacterium]
MAIPLPDAHRRELLQLAVQVAVETVGLLFVMGMALIVVLLLAAMVAPDAALHIGVTG